MLFRFRFERGLFGAVLEILDRRAGWAGHVSKYGLVLFFFFGTRFRVFRTHIAGRAVGRGSARTLIHK